MKKNRGAPKGNQNAKKDPKECRKHHHQVTFTDDEEEIIQSIMEEWKFKSFNQFARYCMLFCTSITNYNGRQ